jgi:hypothetical protein
MKRNFSLAIICISIVVVIIISAYTYYAIDFTQMPSRIVDDRAETKEGVMIYQTKIGGDEWFMDSNLQNDVRFDANANLSTNQDGSWSVDSKEQTRLNVWSKGSEEFRSKEGIDTYNHSIIESRGYWHKPSDC